MEAITLRAFLFMIVFKFVRNYLLAIDQLMNTLCLGHPDETISSRLGRTTNGNHRYIWVKGLRIMVNVLFFFDRGPNGEYHCEKSVMPLEQQNFRTHTDYEIWSWSKRK